MSKHTMRQWTTAQNGDIIAYLTTSHGIWRFIPHRGDYIPRSEAKNDDTHLNKNKMIGKRGFLFTQTEHPLCTHLS